MKIETCSTSIDSDDISFRYYTSDDIEHALHNEKKIIKSLCQCNPNHCSSSRFTNTQMGNFGAVCHMIVLIRY